LFVIGTPFLQAEIELALLEDEWLAEQGRIAVRMDLATVVFTAILTHRLSRADRSSVGAFLVLIAGVTLRSRGADPVITAPVADLGAIGGRITIISGRPVPTFAGVVRAVEPLWALLFAIAVVTLLPIPTRPWLSLADIVGLDAVADVAEVVGRTVLADVVGTVQRTTTLIVDVAGVALDAVRAGAVAPVVHVVAIGRRVAEVAACATLTEVAGAVELTATDIPNAAAVTFDPIATDSVAIAPIVELVAIYIGVAVVATATVLANVASAVECLRTFVVASATVCLDSGPAGVIAYSGDLDAVPVLIARVARRPVATLAGALCTVQTFGAGFVVAATVPFSRITAFARRPLAAII